MSLRSPAEHEKGGVSLSTFPPRLVIPAQAGIQVCSPPPLAWIPAFAGMTECCVNSAYFGFFILWIIHAAVFSKENTFDFEERQPRNWPAQTDDYRRRKYSTGQFWLIGA